MYFLYSYAYYAYARLMALFFILMYAIDKIIA